ncbi:MAG TPA: hypothetical protein VF094_08915 [Gaiellaceae bacterium]
MVTSKAVSRRGAFALATALTATFLTGVAGLGGLAHSNAAAPTTSHAVLVQTVPQANTPWVDD